MDPRPASTNTLTLAFDLENIPSREWIHIPPWEKENHLQICPFFGGRCYSFPGGYVFFNANEMKVKKTKNHQLASQKVALP